MIRTKNPSDPQGKIKGFKFTNWIRKRAFVEELIRLPIGILILALIFFATVTPYEIKKSFSILQPGVISKLGQFVFFNIGNSYLYNLSGKLTEYFLVEYSKYLKCFSIKFTKMASFDIASQVDLQKLDNTVNVVKREIQNRFDFKNTETEIVLDKQNMVIDIQTLNPMGLKPIEDLLIMRGIKQGIDGRAFDFSKEDEHSGKMHKKKIPVKAGIDKESGKKIIQLIKGSKVKVQAAMMDEIVRVSGKKIDELQEVIALLKKSDLGLPLQFINMK